LICLRRYGIRLINGRPRAPNVQGLVEQSNGVAEDKVMKWMHDHNTTLWHGGLPAVTMAMNAQRHTSLGTSPWSVVFRQKKLINWLSAEEAAAEPGVQDEQGEWITEESLSRELEGEKDQEVLNNLRGISDLAIRVPANPLLPSIPLPTPRAERVVPLPLSNRGVTKPSSNDNKGLVYV
jgi:hypothetical protein